MLKEAFEYVVGLLGKAKEVKITQVTGDRPDRRMIVKGDGGHEFVSLDPHDRTLTTDSLAAIIAVASGNFDERINGEDKMLVTYCFGRVELIFNHMRSGERMIWEPPVTREFDFFRKAYDDVNGVTLDVHSAVQMFDVMLRECLPSQKFLEQIGKLKIVGEEQQEAARDATSSLSGGVRTERVDGIEALPPGEQTFNLRIFNDGEVTDRLPVKINIRPHLDSRCWFFQPVESSWQVLLNSATELVGNRLRKGITAGEDKPAVRIVRTHLNQSAPM